MTTTNEQFYEAKKADMLKTIGHDGPFSKYDIEIAFSKGMMAGLDKAAEINAEARENITKTIEGFKP
jgi:hypothetical protein